VIFKLTIKILREFVSRITEPSHIFPEILSTPWASGSQPNPTKPTQSNPLCEASA